MQVFPVLTETLNAANAGDGAGGETDNIIEGVEDNGDTPSAAISGDTIVSPAAPVSPDAPASPAAISGNSRPLTAADLEGHIVPGLNPGGAKVNLFDYWPFDDREREAETNIYDQGISNGHLLIFGKSNLFGRWNMFKGVGEPCKNIVQNRLGGDGYPALNLNGKSDAEFDKHYNDGTKTDTRIPAGFLTQERKTESLAYLFSAEMENAYKESHEDVRGLFRLNEDGYYYYDSEKNFAEYDSGTNSFILYDSPGVGTKEGYYGEFFPFNKATEVFNTVYSAEAGHPYPLSYVDDTDPDVVTNAGASFLDARKKLTSDVAGPGSKYALNHYFGFTLEVPFLQPVDGTLNGGDAMQFNFSGDDDVWIFIDDVLVADLGGIHGKRALSIDFHTGIVKEEAQKGKFLQHTLKESFEAASNPGGAAFKENTNTFADNTIHTLKMFYLERGHNASNMSLNFNLQTDRYNELKKVNQYGDPLAGTTFALYPAVVCDAGDEGSIRCTSTVSGTDCSVKQNGNQPWLTFQTDGGGTAEVKDQDIRGGASFGSSSTNYYILRETRAPEGYRSQPVDIVLEYNKATTMFSVANRWASGAYASFNSYVNERAGNPITYGQYDTGTGMITASGTEVPAASRRDGLVLAVPMLYQNNKNAWLPLYGNNLDGFHTPGAPDGSAEGMRKTLLKAALNQCRYENGWFLEWSGEKQGLEGSLYDLPGRADRYRHINPTGDMRMVYLILEPAALEAAGISGAGSAARYQALKNYVSDKNIDEAVAALYGAPSADVPGTRNVSMLDTSQFMRVFRSLIYISNEQRELQVQKTDPTGTPLDGATFGLYETEEAARQGSGALATGTTATVDGRSGMLVFGPQKGDQAGHAYFAWTKAEASQSTYYLREISAPDGYEVNQTVIPIVIGTYSIYADAGTADDGISVRAGVGRLYQTMAKYASDGDVNITLRDILAVAQTQPSGAFDLTGWTDRASADAMALHYGMNTEMGMSYGRHDSEKAQSSFFTTETGFLRAHVLQNTAALKNGTYDGADNTANWEELVDEDLTGLFSLLNVVVVEDQKKPGAPENPKTPENPQTPENPKTPEDPKTPDEPETPIVPERTRVPEEPQEPEVVEEPDEPEEPQSFEMANVPEDPEDPLDLTDLNDDDVPRDTKDLDDPDDPDDPTDGSPKTGDSYVLLLWAALAVLSLLGIGASLYHILFKKRTEEN